MPIFTASGQMSPKIMSSWFFRNSGETSDIADTVLRRESCDCAHGVNSVHGYCLDVRLNTGASAAIAASDR
jgi:hypothetical protein